jgi:EmrB/QacA subfamily drug resistance transporter
MVMLDTTIVNVALPAFTVSLGADDAQLSWIVTGYTLASGISLIPAGRLGDRIGHKPVFLIGLAVFTAASLWCGLAQSAEELVVARVVQGLGGGIYYPTVTSFIQVLYSGRARGRAFGLMGSVIGVTTALGPLVGGIFLQTLGLQEGWRWIFWVNIPIGLVVLVAGAILLPRGRVPGEQRAGLDPFGIALVSVGLIAITLPLVQTGEGGWPAWTWGLIPVGIAVLVWFFAWERRVQRRGRAPLVPPHLFVHRSFTGGVVNGTAFFAAFTTIFFVLSIYWQSTLGFTALETGLMMVPNSLASVAGAFLSERATHRFGRGVLVIGAALVAVGLIALTLVIALVPGDQVNWLTVLLPTVAVGFGAGYFIAPNTQFIVATVDPSEAGAAAGVVSTVQRLGAALGIAIIAAVFFGVSASAGETVGVTVAIGASAILSILAFALVFTLPKRLPEMHG